MTMTMPTLMARRTAKVRMGRWVGAREERPVKNLAPHLHILMAMNPLIVIGVIRNIFNLHITNFILFIYTMKLPSNIFLGIAIFQLLPM